MRKSAVLTGFGAFFLTMALLLKFYAYDKLAIIPIDQNTSQKLTDPNASYFDVPTLTFRKGELDTVVTAVADKKASEAYGHNVVILDKWQVTNPKGENRKDSQGNPIAMDSSQTRVALNRNSGLPVHCCDESTNGKPTTFEGYTIKLPFNTQKKSYDYWDGTLGKPIALNYKGEEKIKGLTVYRFQSVIPETVYKKEETPGSVFGLAKNSGAQNADRSYKNTRTMWIEPESGVIIKAVEHQQQYLTIPNHDKVTILDTTQQMDDATITKNVDDYKTKSTLLKQLRTTLPWVLGVLGVLLLIAGITTAVLAGRRRRDDRVDDGYDEGQYDEAAYDDSRYDDGYTTQPGTHTTYDAEGDTAPIRRDLGEGGAHSADR